MKKWSQEAWQAALPLYNAILELPFIKELIAGTLPREVFNRYLQQDALYIENYSRVLANIASRLPEIDQVASFLDFAKDGVAVEEEMHKSYLADTDMSKVVKSPACLLYCSILSAQATAPVEVARRSPSFPASGSTTRLVNISKPTRLKGIPTRNGLTPMTTPGSTSQTPAPSKSATGWPKTGRHSCARR